MKLTPTNYKEWTLLEVIILFMMCVKATKKNQMQKDLGISLQSMIQQVAFKINKISLKSNQFLKNCNNF